MTRPIGPTLVADCSVVFIECRPCGIAAISAGTGSGISHGCNTEVTIADLGLRDNHWRDAYATKGHRAGSGSGRRLAVLSVADVFAPGGPLALLAGFRQRQMGEQAIRRGAVPMHRIWWDIDRIARI